MALARACCTHRSALSAAHAVRRLSVSAKLGKEHFKLLIIGGGTAGAATSNKFGPYLGAAKVAVIEPNEMHYYQAGWTMVGGGMYNFEVTQRPEASVLNNKCIWIKDKVGQFSPEKNTVITESGREIEYDFLVIAAGLQLRYDMIKGLPEAFETPGVCSNYHRDYVKKTFPALKRISEGNAIFTFPNTPIKCAGAPQKICYLSDAYLRKTGKRDKVTVVYNTSLPAIFGIKKYADALMEVVERRNIVLNTRHNLVEVKPDSREAVFDVLDEKGQAVRQAVWKYEMLHVGAPCSPIEPLRKCAALTDDKGWVDVHPETLQHKRFPNVFGVGDCANTPNAKTAAAISSQMETLRKNLKLAMKGKTPTAKYDGYASCPLVTDYNKCILAEFTPNGPLETFPFNQAKERFSTFFMKKTFMPFLYWNFLVKGTWEGPKYIRKALHLGMSK